MKEIPMLETGCAFRLTDGTYFFVTCNDYDKNVIIGKHFKTAQEVDDYAHEGSLSQFPKWHEDNCARCMPK